MKENGVIVHISKYKEHESICAHFPANESITEKGKIFDIPPNEFEAKNDPILKERSDYKIEWVTVGEQNLHELKPHINKFVDWLHEKGHI